jgi:hypothetical protein
VLREELVHRLVELELVLLIAETVSSLSFTMYWASTPRFFNASIIWSLSALLTRGSRSLKRRTAAS